MNLKECISSVRNALETNPDLPCVNYASNRPAADSGELLIGQGNWHQCGPVGSHNGICLNNKGASGFLERSYDSVSRFVAEAPQELVEQWQTAVQSHGVESLQPEAILGGMRILSEDVSPDSVLALVILLTRLTGGKLDEQGQHWVRYVERWELGDVRSTGAPESSFGVALSALTHQYLSAENRPESNAVGDDELCPQAPDGDHASRATYCPSPFETDFRAAWRSALCLLFESLDASADPSRLPDVPLGPFHSEALSQIKYERQIYDHILRTGKLVQLMLPVGRAGRRILVDAFLGECHAPLGCLKVFLRTDREHSAIGLGFVLMALYQPHAKGTGNDIVITVDPTSGCHLQELWVELEALEDQRWGESRPCDHPRQGVAGYPNGERSDGRNAPNQPWWDGGIGTAKHTVIAAPRSQFGDQTASTTSGTRLTWTEVKEAIWRLYSPLSGIPAWNEGCDRRLDACVPSKVWRLSTGDARVMVYARWKDLHDSREGDAQEANRIRAFHLVPSVYGSFAAQLDKARKQSVAATQPNSNSNMCSPLLSELPHPSSFNTVSLRGGVVVISADGAFVLDDWHQERVPNEILIDEFDKIMRRMSAIESMKDRIHRIAQIVHEAKTYRSAELGPVMSELADLRMNTKSILRDTQLSSDDPEIHDFRATLERRFGIQDAMDDMSDTMDQLARSLDRIQNARTNSLLRAITLYGFPIGVAGQLFGFSLHRLPDPLGAFFFEGLLIQERIHVTGVVAGLALAIGGMFLLRHLWLGRRGRHEYE